jgi:hypothetical protein
MNTGLKTADTLSQWFAVSGRHSETMHSAAIVVADDVEEFGLETAVALAELPADIARLNRSYRRIVAQRTLRKVPEIYEWCGRTVQVFLRHDEVYVFAVACGDFIGMANQLELTDAAFVVDTTGRQQTLQQSGPLTNFTTVHAFISGTLRRISDETEIPELSGWEPVIYRPSSFESFASAVTGRSIHRSLRVLMVPGRVKVWCSESEIPNAALALSSRGLT